MPKPNPLGFKNHSPFSGFSNELIYGLDADGNTIHISKVDSGLACKCVCPACDHVLIAKKGKKQAHHFAHYNAGVSCKHVAETNAHIWAKDVLEREKRLVIPAVIAEHGENTHEVSPAKIYEFAHARLEKRLGTIVPDVMLETASGAQLIVEVRVTHASEEAKLETLHRENLSAIEIDLRHFRTSSDRQAVEEALLTDAPREWLSNAKQAKFDEHLRNRLEAAEARKATEAEARAKRLKLAEQEKERRAREQVERSVRTLKQAIHDQPEFDQEVPDFVERVMQEFDGIMWSDAQALGFSVDQRVWQAELVLKYLTYPNALEYHGFDEITVRDAMRAIDHCLIPAFRHAIPSPVRTRLRETWPRARVPEEAIEAFFDWLAADGYLTPTWDGSYSLNEDYADRLQERERHKQAYERRLETLRDQISSMMAKLPAPEQAGFNQETWEKAELGEFENCPDALCQQGNETYREFERALKQIELMFDGGAAVERLLGLPLTGEVERAHMHKREKQLRAAANRRQSLTEAARLQLEDEASAWLSAPSDDDEEMSRIDHAGLDDSSYQRTRVELEEATKARRARIRSQNEALSCQNELREAAAKVYDKEHLELFLSASHPRIGKPPIQHCVDLRTLRECLALLPRKQRIGRRR